MTFVKNPHRCKKCGKKTYGIHPDSLQQWDKPYCHNCGYGFKGSMGVKI